MCPVGAASAGYLAGLSCALAANMYHLTINGVQGQPALLYPVPLTIGPVSLLAYSRGELPRLWSGEALLPATQRSLRPVGAAGGAADEARSRRSGWRGSVASSLHAAALWIGARLAAAVRFRRRAGAAGGVVPLQAAAVTSRAANAGGGAPVGRGRTAAAARALWARVRCVRV